MHSDGGFFDRLPVTAEPEAQPPMPPWWQPPPGELPGRSVLDEVLHRDERIVVVLQELRRFSNGLEVRLGWVVRRRELDRREWDDLMLRRVHQPPGSAPTGFQLGLLLDGGTPVFPLGFAGLSPDIDSPTPPTLSANHSGGEGGEDEYRGSFTGWIWAPDALPSSPQLVVEWRDLGVPELRYELDDRLLDALPGPRRLWPAE